MSFVDKLPRPCPYCGNMPSHAWNGMAHTYICDNCYGGPGSPIGYGFSKKAARRNWDDMAEDRGGDAQCLHIRTECGPDKAVNGPDEHGWFHFVETCLDCAAHREVDYNRDGAESSEWYARRT